MKIALFLKEDNAGCDIDSIPVTILHTDNKSVLEVERYSFVQKDVNYIALWLLAKCIKEVYLTDVDITVQKFFRKLGVAVKKFDDLDEDSVLRKYIS